MSVVCECGVSVCVCVWLVWCVSVCETVCVLNIPFVSNQVCVQMTGLRAGLRGLHEGDRFACNGHLRAGLRGLCVDRFACK